MAITFLNHMTVRSLYSLLLGCVWRTSYICKLLTSRKKYENHLQLLCEHTSLKSSFLMSCTSDPYVNVLVLWTIITGEGSKDLWESVGFGLAAQIHYKSDVWAFSDQFSLPLLCVY